MLLDMFYVHRFMIYQVSELAVLAALELDMSLAWLSLTLTARKLLGNFTLEDKQMSALAVNSQGAKTARRAGERRWVTNKKED